jgi:ribonuclease Y
MVGGWLGGTGPGFGHRRDVSTTIVAPDPVDSASAGSPLATRAARSLERLVAVVGDLIPVLLGLMLGLIPGALAGGAALWAWNRKVSGTARTQAEAILVEARSNSQTLLKEAELTAKSEALRRREEMDREADEARTARHEMERRLEKRGDLLDQKLELLTVRERELEAVGKAQALRTIELDRSRAELDGLLAEQRATLHRLSGLGADEARDFLLHRLEEELQRELGHLVQKHEQQLKETCQARARDVLVTCIQRYAATHTADTTTSTIDIPSDDMKGRIIGREGRNIRAFEKATGVDVIVDDTPGIVIVSCFDNIRREIAKLSLEKLIQDGRIHPARVEEIVKETQEEIAAHIRQLGQGAAQEAAVPHVHDKLIEYLGRLQFRTSYSQNVLRHSIEVSLLTGMLADELGLDGKLGRRCGLLHDIGKAVDHEMEGGHPLLGSELCRRFGEGPEVVHAALGHHDDLRHDRPYTVLVAAADAISASRPGARRETLEKYVRRLEELEGLVVGFPGVDQAYAIQAGREVRVLVNSDRVDDPGASKLCRDIAQAIQDQLNYPGEVKVTVLRETRNVEYAR